MPVPGFLSSFADKAQSAIQSSPLAGRIPSYRSSSPSAGTTEQQPSGSGSPTRGSHAFSAISHQFRTLQQTYGNSSPYQKIITSSKGVAMDFDSVSRDVKASSKEMYVWGQTEAEDLKDVTDRLAYFNFVQGSLASTLSTKLNASRVPLKALRDADNNLAGHRTIRAGYDREISKLLEADRGHRDGKRLSELEGLLRAAEIDDDPLEKELELLSRKGIRESEQAKWEALREYGEKLIILSQAANHVISVLPSVPPSANERYSGAQATAAARAAVQHSLDNYRPGNLDLPIAGATAGAPDLSRSDTRSFGVTHAQELSSIGSTGVSQGSSLPHIQEKPAPVQIEKSVATSPPPSNNPVINPLQLNQAPASIPIPAHETPAVVSPDPIHPDVIIPTATPTVAETGIPQSAGPQGPGPSTGTLRDVRSPTNPADSISQGYGVGIGSVSGTIHESAEDEKKRLERQERERVLNATAQPFESAEEEKKRMARQEREKLLAAGPPQASSSDTDDGSNAPAEDLPAYKEF